MKRKSGLIATIAVATMLFSTSAFAAGGDVGRPDVNDETIIRSYPHLHVKTFRIPMPIIAQMPQQLGKRIMKGAAFVAGWDTRNLPKVELTKHPTQHQYNVIVTDTGLFTAGRY